ncbi:TPA: hypothetical protein QHD00_002230 [Enterobacter cloacae subsp. cloacae]|nr:hypothetical protein [Enterobacter cloacae subsp. cloacae]HDT6093700.1 hypothetical protein [Enterobacter cloacae subsp. cloacae]
MGTITTERLTKILSETQAVITECNSRGVHGSVEVNASLFENVLMELLRHRAAMLQGADQPQIAQQNIPEIIPATQFKPVADLYGLTSPTGDETSFTFDAVEARDFIDGGWSCQEYVELERFQEAVSGNSPVIPDGWVVVPVEPTEEMNKAGWTAMNEHDAINPTYRAMLAAAPQQED